MGLKIKYRDPKSTDFKPEDIILNIKEGTLFYKNNENLYKINSINISEPIPPTGIGADSIGGLVIDKMHYITGSLAVSGSIIPEGFGIKDLGSSKHPWRDLHIMTSSVKFYDNQGEIGKISFDRTKGLQLKDTTGKITTDFSASAIRARTIISAPQGKFTGITGSLDGGFF
jgi:hypothetical protein